MHRTYNEILVAADDAEVHPHGYRYVLVELDAGDTCENPASTKEHRRFVGPDLLLWEIHGSGIRVRDYDSRASIPAELRDTAGYVGTKVEA